MPTSAICIHPTGPTSTEQDVPQVSGFYRELLLGPRLGICEEMNFIQSFYTEITAPKKVE